MSTSTAAVFALSALGISMLTIGVYFIIFFGLIGTIFFLIHLFFRPIFSIIRKV